MEVEADADAEAGPKPEQMATTEPALAWPDVPDDSLFDAALTEGSIEALTLQVAENIALQAMSRRCRKGMGYRIDDNPRLRGAEYL